MKYPAWWKYYWHGLFNTSILQLAFTCLYITISFLLRPKSKIWCQSIYLYYKVISYSFQANWTNWQKRWFVLTPGKLTYYVTSKMKEKKGEISVTTKSKIESLEDKTKSFRYPKHRYKVNSCQNILTIPLLCISLIIK